MQKEHNVQIEQIVQMAELLLKENLLDKKALSELEQKINKFLELDYINKQYFKRLF